MFSSKLLLVTGVLGGWVDTADNSDTTSSYSCSLCNRCKIQLQADNDLKVWFQEAMQSALDTANKNYGPRGMPYLLAGSCIGGMSNCLVFDNPDRSMFKGHTGCLPGIMGHMMGEEYRGWRAGEYVKFHAMLKKMDFDTCATWLTWCHGGKHRSYAWKRIFKHICIVLGVEVVEDYCTIAPPRS